MIHQFIPERRRIEATPVTFRDADANRRCEVPTVFRASRRVATPVGALALVPHLVLQPPVENAIRHGIAPRSDPGTVEISAHRSNGSLHLSVADDGVARTAPSEHTSGVGLTNTRDRRRQLYGSSQSLTVTTVTPHGRRLEIIVPFREASSK